MIFIFYCEIVCRLKRKLCLRKRERVLGEVLSFEKAELDRSAEGDSAIALPKSRINIAGHQIAYATLGEGRPIVFVHGNYLSSRIWRSIIPYLAK